jgi:hypothetical protein
MNQTDYQVVADAKTIVSHFLVWYMDKFGEFSGGFDNDKFKSMPDRLNALAWNTDTLDSELTFMIETLQTMQTMVKINDQRRSK